MQNSKTLKIESSGFSEFISSEEYNFSISNLRLKKEFLFFSEIDFIYKEYFKIIQSLKIKPNHESVIWSLMYFVHFNFYFSISTFMRGHCTEAFNPIRRAIDAGLTAYLIIEDNDSAKDYLNGGRRFINVKQTIRNERTSNPSKYPLAKGLIELHETCSAYASHADIRSFIHSLEIKKNKMDFKYFSIPENNNEFKLYFIVSIMSFYYLFKIFKIFIDQKLAKFVIPHLEERCLDLENQLPELQKKFYLAAKGNNIIDSIP